MYIDPQGSSFKSMQKTMAILSPQDLALPLFKLSKMDLMPKTQFAICSSEENLVQVSL